MSALAWPANVAHYKSRQSREREREREREKEIERHRKREREKEREKEKDTFSALFALHFAPRKKIVL
jgi:ribosomal protein L12E/L44/L45/RPP1/RPP2